MENILASCNLSQTKMPKREDFFIQQRSFPFGNSEREGNESSPNTYFFYTTLRAEIILELRFHNFFHIYSTIRSQEFGCFSINKGYLPYSNSGFSLDQFIPLQLLMRLMYTRSNSFEQQCLSGPRTHPVPPCAPTQGHQRQSCCNPPPVSLQFEAHGSREL